MSTFTERVEAERDLQRKQWGDDHDDNQPYAGWSHIFHMQSGKLALAIEEVCESYHEEYEESLPKLRHRLVALAATCMAMDEAIDRAQAHWERLQANES